MHDGPGPAARETRSPPRAGGSLRRVSNAFRAPPFVSARFCNYGAEKFRRSVAPNVRKAVPKCVPPRLRSQSKMLRTGDYRCSGGVSPSRGGARPPAEPQSTANRRLFLAHSIGRARSPSAPQSPALFKTIAVLQLRCGEISCIWWLPGECVYIVELWNYVNTQCGIIHCFCDAFRNSALADGCFHNSTITQFCKSACVMEWSSV